MTRKGGPARRWRPFVLQVSKLLTVCLIANLVASHYFQLLVVVHARVTPAFVSLPHRARFSRNQTTKQSSSVVVGSQSQSEKDASDVAASPKLPEDILDEERRKNLFQFLLRDLQIAGTPLLSVDADQVDTLQAAMWTTMAQLLSGWIHHKGKEKEKACLIFEDIPIEALRSFVSDFQILQTQERLMKHLPELSWFHLETVGRGVGPAIVVTIEPMEKGGKDNTAATNGVHLSDDFFTDNNEEPGFDERRLTAAMKMFTDRVACGMEVCPHFNFDLEVQASQTSYRVCGFSDVCHVLSSFWNAICELQATPSDQLSAVMLMLPTVTEMKTIKDTEGRFVTGPEQRHARFAAVAELISRSLCL